MSLRTHQISSPWSEGKTSGLWTCPYMHADVCGQERISTTIHEVQSSHSYRLTTNQILTPSPHGHGYFWFFQYMPFIFFDGHSIADAEKSCLQWVREICSMCCVDLD